MLFYKVAKRLYVLYVYVLSTSVLHIHIILLKGKLLRNLSFKEIRQDSSNPFESLDCLAFARQSGIIARSARNVQ